MSKPGTSGSLARRRGALATLTLSALLAALGTSIANIALPALGDAFPASFQQIQWVVVAYLASMTLAAAAAGRLGDRFGLKRMHLTGLCLYAAASLLCAAAPDLESLIAARAVQGVGAAFLMTLSIALARESVGEDRLGRAMGLLGTASAIGTALGPSLGGVLVATLGWRATFVVLVPAGLLTLALALRTLPADGNPAAAPAGAGGLGKADLLPGLTANLLVAAVMMTTLVAGPFYLSIRLGLGAAAAGMVMAIGPALSMCGGVLSGRAVDAWGARPVLGVGLVLLTAGAFALGVLPERLGIGGYVLAIAILTPGYQLFQAANNTAVMSSVPKNQRGLASGMLGLSRNLGLVVGAWAMGGLFALSVGTPEMEQATPAAIGRGMEITFGVAGVLMAAALWVALRRPARGGAEART